MILFVITKPEVVPSGCSRLLISCIETALKSTLSLEKVITLAFSGKKWQCPLRLREDTWRTQFRRATKPGVNPPRYHTPVDASLSSDNRFSIYTIQGRLVGRFSGRHSEVVQFLHNKYRNIVICIVKGKGNYSRKYLNF
jgi:hypothetical protein